MPSWIVDWHHNQPRWSVPPLYHPIWWGRWPEQLHRFALSADEREREPYGPFAGYLERPPVLSALGVRFGDGIAEPLRTARARIRELVLELMAVLYPEPARRTVTADDLRGAGFDPGSQCPGPA